MKNRLYLSKLLLIVSILLVVGMGFATYRSVHKDRFDLIIGDQVIPMVLHPDTEKVASEIVDRLEDVWNHLENGESEWFTLRRVHSFDMDPALVARAKVHFGNRASFKSTRTVTLKQARFYKRPEGEGIEARSGEEILPYLSSPGILSWETVRYSLQKSIYTLDSLELFYEQGFDFPTQNVR